MARTKGSKDGRPRQRRKKAPQQKKKDDADKARRMAAQEKADRDRNAGLFRASLFHGQEQPSTATIAPDILVEYDAVQLHGVSSWTEQRNPKEISAELDYDSDDESQEANDANDESDGNKSDGPSNSVMNLYLGAIQDRLKFECLEDADSDLQWLLELLEDNDWWIRKELAPYVCGELKVVPEEIAYYRDVYVWLPQIRWGHVAVPPCPYCKSHLRVGNKGWQSKHYARRVVTMKSNYFIMARRHQCHRCAHDPSTKEDGAFMGYNPISRANLPFGLGEYFPAFFTHKSAVDKEVIDMMRALFDKGVRPESFAETMLELHAKKWIDEYLRRERKIEQKGHFGKKPSMFSAFSDKMLYAGLVPTGKYLAHVYKLHNATLRPYFAQEIKKQSSKRFHIDASYKEAKHLSQYRGKPVFKSLITVTNEIGAIRLQFHTVTDGHDQMEPAIEAFVKTAMEYGQPLPELAATDNPGRDRNFLYEKIPSLQKTQDRLDGLAQTVAVLREDGNIAENEAQNDTAVINNAANVLQPTVLATSNIDDFKRIRVASSVEDIRATVTAIRSIMSDKPQGQRILTLDIEWDTKKNRSGQVVKSYKTAVIQLGFRDSEDRISALILQVFRHTKLHQSLVSLFSDPQITFVGAGVSADLIRIGKDFDCTKATNSANYLNLGSYARKRDVVQSGTVSLEKLVQLVLHEHLDKSPAVRLSKWSLLKLSDVQTNYAALDVMKPLEVYEQLRNLPDLTLRLSLDDVTANLQVDIVPSHGNVASMATRAAMGSISNDVVCVSPLGITPRRIKPSPETAIVTITSVMSPSLVVLGMKKGRTRKERVCLGDFGPPPFSIVLPLNMLKCHVDSPAVRTFSEVNPSANSLGVARCTLPTSARRSALETDVLDFTETDDRMVNNFLEDNNLDKENGGLLEGGDSELCQNLSTRDVELVALAGIAAEQAQQHDTPSMSCEHLDDPPANIVDVFSACLGDAFHAMDRPKVPVKHEYKKPYFVALQEAFFAWRPDLLADVKETLQLNGFTTEDVEALLYYNVKFFRDRVDRRVLPPKQLYWRVRSVFVLFGNKCDSKTNKPLFNQRAWNKANNVLNEILLGYYSDPPGFSFYTSRLDKRGEPMVDQYGIALINCNRGTNDVEAFHKQLVAIYGSWCTGVEMSDALLSERRHRYNQKINERKRLGFPKLMHFDTWKVDMLQLLVEKNHGILLYPDWSNASDYKETAESFDTVALHSQELHEAVASIELDEKVVKKFTAEMKYLCRAMGIQVPFLPNHGADEAKLFTRLVLEMPVFDESLMTIEWCKYVNGETIFPKLPVYLRMYYERWERNQRIKDAIRSSKSEVDLLAEVNSSHMLLPNGISSNDPQEIAVGTGVASVDNQSNGHEQNEAAESSMPSGFTGWEEVAMPIPILQPRYEAIRPHEKLGPPVVGGLLIGLTDCDGAAHKRRFRGKDKRSSGRRKRSCTRCTKFSGQNGLICVGRIGNKGGARACQYFEENGDVV